MPCVFCGVELQNRRVTFTHDQDGKYLIVENVLAKVCTRCGEKTYSPQVTDELSKFARQESKPLKEVTVPVFDFARRARA